MTRKPPPKLPRLSREPDVALHQLADHLANFGIGWRALAIHEAAGAELHRELSAAVESLLDQFAVLTKCGDNEWAAACMEFSDAIRAARDGLAERAA